MREKLVTSETMGKKVKFSSDLGFNDVKYAFTYGDETSHFMQRLKYVPIQENETSAEKLSVTNF